VLYNRGFELDNGDEDILDNFCLSAHLSCAVAHTEFEVTGGCSMCLPL
jgi:hypothetical protein